eukprot:13719402-Alexandrium_andersonii.AAC.1
MCIRDRSGTSSIPASCVALRRVLSSGPRPFFCRAVVSYTESSALLVLVPRPCLRPASFEVP